MKKEKQNESLKHTLNELFVTGILLISVVLFVIKENLISIIVKIKCNDQSTELKQDVDKRTYCIPPIS